MCHSIYFIMVLIIISLMTNDIAYHFFPMEGYLSCPYLPSRLEDYGSVRLGHIAEMTKLTKGTP